MKKQQERFVYPKFSKYELGFARLGGPGLGNLLFILARAIKLSEEHNMRLIWPTWASIKVGPWIRREKDKRFYGDLFENNGNYISGIKKIGLLLFAKKESVDSTDQEITSSGRVILYKAFKMRFEDLLLHRSTIRQEIFSIAKEKNLGALKHDFTNEINVHVRLGDFSQGSSTQLSKETVNTRLPIDWYAKAIKDIQEVLGDKIVFNIFSDGTDEELQPILSISGTQRVFYGNALADIIGLSQSKVIIASASSFSMWGRFLGNSSCITYKNQLFEKICTDPDGFEFDYGFEDALSVDVQTKIKKFYQE